MQPTRIPGFLLISLLATSLSATTFVVPDDAELVAKSPAIVIAKIIGSSAREGAAGIETVYRIHIERALKGPFASGSTINIVSLGGRLGDRFTIVASAAHFDAGEQALLFLTPYEDSWTPTDLTIGKFRFANAADGTRLLVRDAEDILGWDRDGKRHVEPLRREQEFLRFVENRIGGRVAAPDYFTNESAPAVTPAARFNATTDRFADVEVQAAPFPAATYTNWFLDGNGGGFPARWANMGAGVTYLKNASQNASGLGDGGVSIIQTAMASWNNECNSAINMIYGGTTAALHNSSDKINVVLFNDPQGNVPGSWTGSGTIAITFGQGGGFHTFDNRSDWVSITDEDLVFQDGFPGTHPVMPTAMTHELGHSIGWRHSNAHYQVSASFTDQACQPSIEECTTNAIMNATSIASLGYTLQTWDVNAAQAVYPGGSCTPPPPSGRTRGDANGDGIADIFWRHDNGSNFMWQMTSNANLGQPLTMETAQPPSWRQVAHGDFDGDGKTDIFWREPASGANFMWLLNGSVVANRGAIQSVDPAWSVVGSGDFNGDGKADILWRHTNGTAFVWIMNGLTVASGGTLQQVDNSWRLFVYGDITGDNKADIVLRQTTSGANFLWTMNGASIAASTQMESVPDTAWNIEALVDMNGDGRSDIFWRRTTGDTFVWLLSGATVINRGALDPVSDTNWKVVAVGDFDGNGTGDIFWRHQTTGGTFVWQMNGITKIGGHPIQTIDTAWKIVGPK